MRLRENIYHKILTKRQKKTRSTIGKPGRKVFRVLVNNCGFTGFFIGCKPGGFGTVLSEMYTRQSFLLF